MDGETASSWCNSKKGCLFVCGCVYCIQPFRTLSQIPDLNPLISLSLHHHTAPLMPLNLLQCTILTGMGVAEQINCTFIELVCNMLVGQNLLSFLCAEAAAHPVYIWNHVPTKVLDGKTPYEVWTGRKPNIPHLQNLELMYGPKEEN